MMPKVEWRGPVGLEVGLEVDGRLNVRSFPTTVLVPSLVLMSLFALFVRLVESPALLGTERLDPAGSVTIPGMMV